MKQIDLLRKLALSMPETTEESHFEKTSFRVKNKIFATYDDHLNQACIKLSEKDQDVFSRIDKTAIYPVPNKWGKQGWTIIQLDQVNEDILKDALITTYCAVAPKNLADLVRPEERK